MKRKYEDIHHNFTTRDTDIVILQLLKLQDLRQLTLVNKYFYHLSQDLLLKNKLIVATNKSENVLNYITVRNIFNLPLYYLKMKDINPILNRIKLNYKNHHDYRVWKIELFMWFYPYLSIELISDDDDEVSIQLRITPKQLKEILIYLIYNQLIFTY